MGRQSLSSSQSTAPRAARRPPRRRGARPCGGPRTWPPRSASPTRPGRRAPLRAARSAASACFDRLLGLLLRGEAVLRGTRGLAACSVTSAGVAGHAPAALAVGAHAALPLRRRIARVPHAVRDAVAIAPAAMRSAAAARAARRSFVAHPHVLGPAAGIAAQRALLDRDRARADRVEQRAVVGDEQDRAGERAQRVLERLAALDVEVVRGLVEDQHVRAARCTSTASDSRRRSPPESPASGFSASSPENRKRPSSARALFGRQPRGALGRVEHALVSDRRPRRARPRAGRGSRPSRCARC